MNALTLTDAVRTRVVDEVRRFGVRGVETGGFLLASWGSDAVTGVALAGTAGVIRHRDVFQISDLALDAVFAFADEHDLWIPAQFHSHGHVAEPSLCDLEHGLSVEGFTSTIIPFFADPPSDVAAWGWWRYDCVWRRLPPPEVAVATPLLSVTFDENGSRQESARGG